LKKPKNHNKQLQKMLKLKKENINVLKSPKKLLKKKQENLKWVKEPFPKRKMMMRM
jgi:hypothetical protein